MRNFNIKLVRVLITGLITLTSCDHSKPLDIENGKEYLAQSDCGSLKVRSSRFSDLVIVSQSFNGKFLVQPDSLKIGFHPKNIRASDIKFTQYIDKKESRIHGSPISINGESVISLSFSLESDEKYSIDTAYMYISPCNYIMCNDRSMIKDTLKIRLKH